MKLFGPCHSPMADLILLVALTESDRILPAVRRPREGCEVRRDGGIRPAER